MAEKETSLPSVLPGHWTTPSGFEVARHYERAVRERLPLGHRSDLEIAYDIFMVDATSFEMIAMQKVAQERIRWLSVQLALAKQATAPDPVPLFDRIKDFRRTLGFSKRVKFDGELRPIFDPTTPHLRIDYPDALYHVGEDDFTRAKLAVES